MNTKQPLAPPLDHAWIAAHIPHSGAMCLLDEVVQWDAETIRCMATSHRDPHNPLRMNGRLGAVCGVEYAAQAMAVHGAVLGAASGQPRVGFLASLRNVETHVARLDLIEAPLDVTAVRIGGDANNVLYRFTVRDGEQTLVEGRAAVILDASTTAVGFHNA
ncbi:hotdog family protein [Trinickia caryophylli]|uniref:Predicted 3-hydroxylacyl-ACP dehydratase, HotDog domain n=1 Tax=Trinickia caryophylli TaxID=28094 RepID=A0A1X7CE48_TRICW|nr:hotdog family protein [Trinickia caryophylli]PMS12580.1 hydroxymyristoyl-ACP dehydratase [Trinickia caryophylli]TRX19785.1 hydroxymyristoyl-ACP dehydratase [Trinickia caryophylli]WQE12887.1 hotdog family protein [Trinickia caryophylli]SME95137.1 Predicted 3-hydroxylacyl-ACP dehydratase, HotDog domain [Trinickia caryophylli]GLU30610.1 phosphotransferase [Trinickia caryophylli]